MISGPGGPPFGRAVEPASQPGHDILGDALGHRVRCDPLTDLANRRGLFEALWTAEERDVLAVGDLVQVRPDSGLDPEYASELVALTVATRLRSSIRPNDLAARVEPSEFAVLMRDVRDDELPPRGARSGPRLRAPSRSTASWWTRGSPSVPSACAPVRTQT
jgi:GGDEF domain-containing protein